MTAALLASIREGRLAGAGLVAELETQIRTLTALLRKDQASTAAAERRLILTQMELEAANSRAPAPRLPKERAQSPKTRVSLPKAKRRLTRRAVKRRAR